MEIMTLLTALFLFFFKLKSNTLFLELSHVTSFLVIIIRQHNSKTISLIIITIELEITTTQLITIKIFLYLLQILLLIHLLIKQNFHNTFQTSPDLILSSKIPQSPTISLLRLL